MNPFHKALGFLLAGAVAVTAPAAFAAETYVNVLTGGTSGVYYPLGVALANAIGKNLPSVKTSVQATKASVENLNLLE
ncbi:MAG: C4-dicarboxylate ABC transporter, partial [Betaproteobacteria bacterium]|nr:C4-dicarboxylate ABC transporter [Betaproteobacteria bacterium]